MCLIKYLLNTNMATNNSTGVSTYSKGTCDTVVTGGVVTTTGGVAGGGDTCTGPRYKKVFIQRDYSQGTSVRFQTAFPPELQGYIDQESFSYLINNINLMYSQGETMSTRVFCESCCACLSAYFLYLCIEPYYDKCARKVGDFIEEQNDLRWKRRGLLVTDPLERGLRVIEITIFLDKVPN